MTAAEPDAPRASGAPVGIRDGDQEARRSLPTITLADGGTRVDGTAGHDDWRVLADGGTGDPATVAIAAARTALEDALRAFLPANRWYPAGQQGVARVTVADSVWLPGDDDGTDVGTGTGDAAPGRRCLVLLDVTSPEGEHEAFLVGLATVGEDAAGPLLDARPHAGIAWVATDADARDRAPRHLLFDGFADPAFGEALLRALAGGGALTSRLGRPVVLDPTRQLRALTASSTALDARVVGVEQSNTSIVFGTDVVLKVLRRPRPGLNPDLEVGRFLTDQASFANAAPVLGGIEYAPGTDEHRTLAVANGFILNDGDAWEHALRSLSTFFEQWPGGDDAPTAAPWPATLSSPETPDARTGQVMGRFGDDAELLGRRTAQLHLALASATDAAFRPEPLTADDHHQRQQQATDDVRTTMTLLRRSIDRLEPSARRDANAVLGLERAIEARLRDLPVDPAGVLRMRVHGDYHLGQVLHVPPPAGAAEAARGDFVIVDFEGEPSRSLPERRRKRLALVDVAGMIRSFQYAAHAGALAATAAHDDVDPSRSGAGRARSFAAAERFWHDTAVARFLGGYRREAAGAPFLPADAGRFEALLAVHLLDKALYEIRYELAHRPDWVAIPLRGVVELFEEER